LGESGLVHLPLQDIMRMCGISSGARQLGGVVMPVKGSIAQRYIELLKKSLLGELYIDNEARIILTINSLLNELRLTYSDLYDIRAQTQLFEVLRNSKEEGTIVVLSRRNKDGSTTPALAMRNYTELSHTMIGRKRLDNIQYCIETVLDEHIPGDVIETGIWRGGATIFMRGVLAAHGVTDRLVWAADSFEGVPPPTHPQDADLDLSAKVYPFLAVSLQQVSDLFESYGLLDDQVRFIKGWFKDTLPAAPIETLAVLRLDGDLYESTMDALNPLYAKVPSGGFVIVDDYHSCPPCKHAVDEFRSARGISDEMIRIDEQSIFWRKRPA
jgi:O-methyltransferase